MPSTLTTAVLIIGGGVTGTGLARDLALRGVPSLLVEKQDINAGASGGNHGLLHSGARYVASDPASAGECAREGELLKALAPQCIESTGGIFAAVQGDDERYIADFPALCRGSGVAAAPLDPAVAREMEPALSTRLIAAFRVEDATVDPFRLSLENMAQAQSLGARLIRFARAVRFERSGGVIRRVALQDQVSGRATLVEAQVVVNAAGAWAGEVAALAGARIAMRCSKGSLLVTQERIGRRVINRLRPPTDGDILVPGGTVSILGTTSERVASPDAIYPEVSEVDRIIAEGTALIPSLATTRYIRAYCGVRPLLDSPGGAGDDRAVSRGFALIDHGSRQGEPENLVTITGGKLTTFRLMAEKAADLVCRRLGVSAPGRTALEPLPDTVAARWTEPGLAPNEWLRRHDPEDALLCECEMVSRSVVDAVAAEVVRQRWKPGLRTISLRSRVGKGPCQGTFCSQRVLAHLCDRELIDGALGPAELRHFLQERWRGQHPLLWNASLVQAELLEAMHCGIFGLELLEPLPAASAGEWQGAAGEGGRHGG
jgi:glycerol-3-phosphate dehydrogenase